MTLFDWIFILCCTAILCVAIGVLIGIFIMIKPVIRRVKGIPIKSVQRNGSFEVVDKNLGDWAEKLTSDRDEIDYHGADRLGGTDNGEEEQE